MTTPDLAYWLMRYQTDRNSRRTIKAARRVEAAKAELRRSIAMDHADAVLRHYVEETERLPAEA